MENGDYVDEVFFLDSGDKVKLKRTLVSFLDFSSKANISPAVSSLFKKKFNLRAVLHESTVFPILFQFS